MGTRPGVQARSVLEIRYRSRPDGRGRTRLVVCKLVAPVSVDPVEVDLLEAILPAAELTQSTAVSEEFL